MAVSRLADQCEHPLKIRNVPGHEVAELRVHHVPVNQTVADPRIATEVAVPQEQGNATLTVSVHVCQLPFHHYRVKMVGADDRPHNSRGEPRILCRILEV